MLGDHRGGSALEDRFEMMVVGQVESAGLLYLGALPLPVQLPFPRQQSHAPTPET